MPCRIHTMALESGVGIVGGSRALASLNPGFTYSRTITSSPSASRTRLSPLGLVGQHQDGVRVGVIDVLGGQKGVRKGFNGRRCGVRIEKMSAKLVRHRGVGKLRERAKPLEKLEVDGRMPLRLDVGQIEARGFHIKGRDLLAQDVRGKRP